MKKIIFIFSLLPFMLMAQNQNFYFGNDLSYVNQMEDCGAVYKENNLAKDPFKIFADHGTNLVRVRLWKDPSWWQDPLNQPEGVKPHYNDLEDVKKTIRRAKENGMEVMLGIHYSDFWADPGQQLIPRAWVGVAYDLEALKDSVYNYTVQVLSELESEGLMPNIVKIGNENNKGLLTDIPKENGYDIKETVSTSWVRHAELFNTAIKAVRDVGATASINPKIALHMTNGLSGMVWNYENRFIKNGVTDFDIIGLSYYYSWHQGSIPELQKTVSDLVGKFSGYEVMAVETGYPWTNQNFDALGNIVTTPDPEYLPLSPERQLEYMIDYTRAVMNGGGNGVIFWEPAWVTTPCRTPWGVGSSHDHLAFFDPVNTNFMENGGGRWTESLWYDMDQVKVTFKADMYKQDVTDGVYLMGNFTEAPIRMNLEKDYIYYQYRFMNKGASGSFYFLNGPEVSARENVPAACAVSGGTDRAFVVPNENIVLDYRWSSCEASNPDRAIIHNLTFKVDLTGHNEGEGAFVTGSFTGDPWKIVPMIDEGGNIYSHTVETKEGRTGAFYFLNRNEWGAREAVPEVCATWWGTDRGYEMGKTDISYSYAFGSCDENLLLSTMNLEDALKIFPNPVSDYFSIDSSEIIQSVKLFDLAGRLVKEMEGTNARHIEFNQIGDLEAGIYILQTYSPSQKIMKSILIKR